MKLDPLPPEQDPLELRLDLLGSLIHGVLDDLQGEFREEMASPDPRRLLSRMAERARELLEEKWRSQSRTLAPNLPVVQQLLREQWAKSLARAIEADLGLLEDEHRIPEEIEVDLRADLAFARPGCAPISIKVIGRPDRVDRNRDGPDLVKGISIGTRRL